MISRKEKGVKGFLYYFFFIKLYIRIEGEKKREGKNILFFFFFPSSFFIQNFFEKAKERYNIYPSLSKEI